MKMKDSNINLFSSFLFRKTSVMNVAFHSNIIPPKSLLRNMRSHTIFFFGQITANLNFLSFIFNYFLIFLPIIFSLKYNHIFSTVQMVNSVYLDFFVDQTVIISIYSKLISIVKYWSESLWNRDVRDLFCVVIFN